MEEFNSIINEKFNKTILKHSFNKKNIKDINDILNIKELKRIIQCNYSFSNKFSKFKKINNGWFIVNRFDKSLIEKFTPLSKELILLNKDSIKLQCIETIIKYLYLEVFILLEYYINNKIDSVVFRDNLDIIFKNKQKNIQKKKNWNLLTTNESAIELPKDKVKYLNYDFLREKLELKLIEIPIAFNRKKLIYFMKELLSLKNYLKIEKLNFNLRFKRIKKYNKKGMFVVKVNTIILDPRELNSIYHEIGHFLYHTETPFTINNKRYFKTSFKNIINKNRNKFIDIVNIYSKVEDYDIDSEIFPLWFETEYFKYK